MSHTCKRLVKTLLKNEVSQTCTDILVSGSLDVYKDRKKFESILKTFFSKFFFQNLSPLLRKLAIEEVLKTRKAITYSQFWLE